MIFSLRSLLAVPLLFLASCEGRTATPPTVDFGSSAEKSSPAIAIAGRVTDAANILDPAQEAALTAKLDSLERRTQHQMVIVTVPSLGGQDIASHTRNLENSWGIGRKGYDDGVVLLVAPNERQVRIAVGFGLEKVLTREVCQQIIDSLMLPRFRVGDLLGGIEAGTDALIVRLS